MKAFATRYPLLFAVCVTLAGVLALLWPFRLPGLSTTAVILLARISATLIAVGTLTSLSWWREAGFARPTSWRVVLPYLPLACVALLLPIASAAAALAYARNIWPLVFIHAGTNFTSYLLTGDHLNATRPALADAVAQVILLALPALFGFWLVRRAERKAPGTAGMASRSAITAMPADSSSGSAQPPR